MYRNIKLLIRKQIIKQFAKLYAEIVTRYEENEWKKIRIQFKNIGKDECVKYPYVFTNPSSISIGEGFYSDQNLRIDAIKCYLNQTFNPEIVIGKNVSIQSNCHIGSINKITIGDNVLIASNVYISDHFHGNIMKKDLSIPPLMRELISKGEVNIGKNVWIGESVCILPGVSVGENSIIGANSVVTKSFPSNVVIAGSPAIIIKRL